jgi:hypothetical protein
MPINDIEADANARSVGNPHVKQRLSGATLHPGTDGIHLGASGLEAALATACFRRDAVALSAHDGLSMPTDRQERHDRDRLAAKIP